MIKLAALALIFFHAGDKIPDGYFWPDSTGKFKAEFSADGYYYISPRGILYVTCYRDTGKFCLFIDHADMSAHPHSMERVFVDFKDHK